MPARVVSLLLLALSTPVSSAPAPAPTDVRRTMDLNLDAGADVAFPLFGPVRETEWSPDWAPTFLTPRPPAQGPDGAVFTTDDHGTPSVWVMTDYDTTARHVAYVIVTPGATVCRLDVRVDPAGPDRCVARVTHRFTSLGPDGDTRIQRWLAHGDGRAAHWTQAIDAALSKGGHR